MHASLKLLVCIKEIMLMDYCGVSYMIVHSTNQEKFLQLASRLKTYHAFRIYQRNIADRLLWYPFHGGPFNQAINLHSCVPFSTGDSGLCWPLLNHVAMYSISGLSASSSNPYQILNCMQIEISLSDIRFRSVKKLFPIRWNQPRQILHSYMLFDNLTTLKILWKVGR